MHRLELRTALVDRCSLMNPSVLPSEIKSSLGPRGALLQRANPSSAEVAPGAVVGGSNARIVPNLIPGSHSFGVTWTWSRMDTVFNWWNLVDLQAFSELRCDERVNADLE